VGGDDAGDAAHREGLEHRLGERGALLGIGADGDLVDQDQRAVARGREQLAQVDHVAGERRQVVLQALRVADVGADVGEPAHRAAALGGDVVAAPHHQRGQPDGLERDGLAAGVGPSRARCRPRP
jgi:hypothetical protein